jgi:Rrf2 family protein
MRMSEGVEWAIHSCLNLTWLEPGEAVTAARMAAFYRLPAAYLNKQLQALARAGILTSTPGPRGGFRLARGPEDITLLDLGTELAGQTLADKMMGSNALQQMEGTVPGLRDVHIVEGSGHFVQMEAAGEVNEAMLAFLARLG